MERIETTLGPVPVWSSGSFDSDRPLLVAIRGAFPNPDAMADLDPPGADLALLHLPGFIAPAIRPIAIETFASAFDEVIQRRFARRRVTLAGASAGALVALSMGSPQIEAVLAVEPFFSTAKLWPLIEFVQNELRAHPQPLLHEWCEAIFGYTADGVVDRDYGHLAATPSRPTLMLAGETPLQPRRPCSGLPSLLDDRDRGLLSCKVVPGGHKIETAQIRAALVELQTLQTDVA